VKTRIIVNPMANKGNCGKRWPQILAELEKHLGPISSADVAMTRVRSRNGAGAGSGQYRISAPDRGGRRRHVQ
jgi:hypothetical protein